MRLWCFIQNTEVFKDFDLFTRLYNRNNNSAIGPTDDDTSMVNCLYGLSNIIPFIAVAAAPYGNCLNYDAIYRNIYWLRTFFEEGVTLFELEVPEDDVLAVRIPQAEYPYMTTGKLQYVRAYRVDGLPVYAILPYIEKEWIASRWGFAGNSHQFGTRELGLYENLCPAIRKPLHVDYDAWNPIDINGFDQRIYDAVRTAQIGYGMHGAPGYYTFEEAMASCDDETIKVLKECERQLGIIPEQRYLITISRLLVP